jgi:hypothetical protein
MPEANWFSDEEGIATSRPQGWKATFHELVWRIGLPVSMVGAGWWVKLVRGPWRSVKRYAYRPDEFLDDSFVEIATSGRKGHVFGAIHTCLVHGPVQLSLNEARRIHGWWKMSGAALAGQESAAPELREVRMATLRHVLQEALQGLDRAGVLGRATVFVISDHGPRALTVSRRMTSNVMMALFDPTGSGGAVVRSPVSLVDIAPTIRQLLGMRQSVSDGFPLPNGSGPPDTNRTVVSKPLRNLDGLLETMGLSGKLSPQTMSRLGKLRSDGTFDYTRSFLQDASMKLDNCCGERP